MTVSMRPRSLRWMALALAGMVALQHHSVAADADCLGDGATCTIDLGCPKLCCTGMSPRTSGGSLYCPEKDAVFRTTPNDTPGTAWVPLSTAPTTTVTDSASSAPTEGEDAAATTSSSATDDNATGTAETEAPVEPVATETEAPASAGKTSSVDAFQSANTIAGSRDNLGGSSTIFIAVGALAGCVVLVAAVVYKRKGSTTKDLEIPGSSYHGAHGSGLTPDNRSLDGMMDGGARGSNDSMKQLPVLSMAGREGSSIARLSSPFGQNSARISSPAHRGGTNEDYAFDVELGSRAGSSVQVAFVDAGDQSSEFVPENNGVVAL